MQGIAGVGVFNYCLRDLLCFISVCIAYYAGDSLSLGLALLEMERNPSPKIPYQTKALESCNLMAK